MSKELDEANDKDVSGKGSSDAAGKTVTDAKPTGKRAAKQGKADANKSVDPTADSVEKSKVPGQAGVKEAVAEIFEGQDLSEDFMNKAETIFEAAVNERVHLAKESLEEQFEAKLEEELEGAVNDLVEKIDDYLDYAVSHYMEENAIAIERGLQVEMAESFMDGLKGLFVEHNVSVTEEELDVVAEMAEQMEEMESKLNEAIETNITLHEKVRESEAAAAFAEVAEGLTDSQAVRLGALTEGFDLDDIEQFKKKVEMVKENYFGSATKVLSESFDEEPIDIGGNETYVDQNIAAIAAAISKSVKR